MNQKPSRSLAGLHPFAAPCEDFLLTDKSGSTLAYLELSDKWNVWEGEPHKSKLLFKSDCWSEILYFANTNF